MALVEDHLNAVQYDKHNTQVNNHNHVSRGINAQAQAPRTQNTPKKKTVITQTLKFATKYKLVNSGNNYKHGEQVSEKIPSTLSSIVTRQLP